MNKKHTLLSLMFLLCSLTLSIAHEFWLLPASFFAKKGKAVEIGINVGEDYMGEHWGGGDRRVQRLRLITPTQIKDMTATVTQSDAAVKLAPFTFTQEGTQMLTLETNSSFIELEPKKFEEYLKEDGLDIALSYRKKNGEVQKKGRELYRRCAKTLVQVAKETNTKVTQNTGMILEIIPSQNPYSLPKGSTLTCQFLYENKPLKNALVRCWRRVNGKTELEFKRTSSDGNATFALPKKGNAAYMISMVNMVRLQDNAIADWQSTWGSLTFGLK